MYCSVNDAFGSVRIRTKSAALSASNSTRIGRRPCNSGIRSDGLETWKAPDAMNKMWSVFTIPCLVVTVQPSISGNRSRCTPSRDTPPSFESLRLQILSISSRKTMPLFSTAKMAFSFNSSGLTSFAASSSTSCFNASFTFILRDFVVEPPDKFWNMPCN